MTGQEIWAVAPGFPDYDVSTAGRVRRNKAGCGTYVGRIVQGAINRYGYRTVGIQRAGKTCNVTVHGLVARAFIGPRPDGCEVAHGDGDKANNAVENLRWATSAENKQDSRNHGVIARGERNGGGGKLTEQQAREIKYGSLSQSKAADYYGVSDSMVWAIRKGRSWAHV